MVMVALDLGTSNAVASVLDGGRPALIPLKGGEKAIPSVVAIDERGRWLVGREAKAQLLRRPADTVCGMKTLLGRSAESTGFRLEVEQLGYRLGEGSEGPAALVGDRELSIIDAAGMVLRELRGQAQDSLGTPLEHAVMPVPEYFTDDQRVALAEAACRAGLTKVWVIEETDALIRLLGSRRSSNRARDELVFFYGLGGGVFDAAVMERTKDGRYEVVAANGEDLGGSHLDRRLASHLVDLFVRAHRLGSFSDRVGLQRILEAAEAAKIQLDEEDSTVVSLPFLCTGNGGRPLDLKYEIGRKDLLRLTGDLIMQTIGLCRSILRAARLQPHQIDAVYLYGRSSRCREVLAATTHLFGKVPTRLPDDATALGSAVIAAQSSRSSPEQSPVA